MSEGVGGRGAGDETQAGAPADTIAGVVQMRRWLWRGLGALETLPRGAVFGLGAASIVGLGVVDHLTGPLISLTIFYLVPVTVIAWVLGRRAGFVLAVLAAVTWALADRLGPVAAPYTPVSYWNDSVLVAVFFFVVVLATRLKATWAWENRLLADVQRRLLPPVFSPVPGYEIACRWIPAGVVGGDYYDLVERPDGRVAFCVADVSGKGMPAALVMSNVQATIRALTAECLPADRLVGRVNRSLASVLRSDSFVTLFYAVHDPGNGVLAYVNAGHPFPMLVRAHGEVERLESSGPVLAVLPEAAYAVRTTALGPGDRLVLFTDGLTERAAASGEEFGELRLQTLAGAGKVESADAMCDRIVDAVRRFGNGSFEDDVTLLVVVPTGRTASEEV